MPLTFTGANQNAINTRQLTGFYSLDRAFTSRDKEIGWPLPSEVEVSGPFGVGKTNFAFSIGGIIAKALGGNISWVELETQNRKTIRAILENTKFSGEVNCIFDKRDEKMVDELLDDILDDKGKDTSYSVGILDSVAAFSSSAEQGGEIGDSNMGRRAMPMAQVYRRAERLMQRREYPFTLISTNHQYQKIGGMTKWEVVTPGGTAKNFMAHNLIRLKQSFAYRYPDGWLVDGKVVKNRDGFTGLTFQVFMVAGEGLHVGLSALFDCANFGLCKIDKKVVIMNGEKMGHLKDIVADRKNVDFAPFHNALKEAKINTVFTKEEDDTEEVPDEE